MKKTVIQLSLVSLIAMFIVGCQTKKKPAPMIQIPPLKEKVQPIQPEVQTPTESPEIEETKKGIAELEFKAKRIRSMRNSEYEFIRKTFSEKDLADVEEEIAESKAKLKMLRDRKKELPSLTIGTLVLN